MANTRETMGDQATLDALVAGTFSGRFEEDGATRIESRRLSLPALTSVRLPNLTNIGQGGFAKSGITSVGPNDLPAVTTVKNTAFSQCAALTSVELPEATTLDSSVFNGCTALASVSLPKVTTVGNSAFKDCTSLTSVALPSVSSIGTSNTAETDHPFKGCANLETLDFSQGIKLPGLATLLPALKNIVLRFSGTSNNINSMSLNALKKSLVTLRRGAVFVPQGSISFYKNKFGNTYTILPIETRYPVSNDDYSSITDSWAEILAAESDGTYSSKYALGDTKKLTINGDTYYAMIVAFDEDDLADNSGKAKITWLLAGAVLPNQKMFDTTPAANAWEDSALRSYLISDILPNMSVKDYVKTVKKISMCYDGSLAEETSDDSIWIPSRHEMLGSPSWQSGLETTGAVYTFLTPSASSVLRIRYSDTTLGEALYWTRTANNASKNYRINGSGTSSSSDTSAVTSATPYIIGFCT